MSKSEIKQKLQFPCNNIGGISRREVMGPFEHPIYKNPTP
jgi:hypothetical protein